MKRQNSQNEFQPKKQNYLEIFGNMLKENTNHFSIKQKVNKMMQRVQGLTYSALVQTQDKYIQKLGIFTHDENLFNFIGKLLNQKQSLFLDEHQKGYVSIKSNIKPPPQPEPQPSPQLVQQVQNVLANIDLPLSLFKRNDNYWSIDNPKTKQAQQYLKKLRQKDDQTKAQIRKKNQQIRKQKQQAYSKTIEVIKKRQQNQKKHLQEKINQKLQQLRKNDESRKKAISQSVDFLKERGVPLFKKIQKQFKQKVQMSTLEDKKRKLSQLRQIMRSVPLEQIQSHRQRYEKLRSEHQQRKIVNQPLNVSFKSQFYEQIKSMSASRFNQMQSNLSLYQKKLQYSRMVKESYKPAIDELKKEEIQSRIKLMNKRRARVKKVKKQSKDSDQEDQQDESEEESEQQEEPQPEDDSQEDQDDQKSQKDDQYEPSNKERYKMGLNYLQEARKLAAKKSKQNQKTQQNNQSKKFDVSSVNKTIDFDIPKDQKEGRQTINQNQKNKKFVWASKYDEQQKKQQKIKYRNYLRQMDNGSQSIDLMDTNRIKKQIEKTLQDRSRAKTRFEDKRKNIDIDTEIMQQTNLQNKLRNIQQRAKNQEQLLRFKRVNKSQKIKKKMAIDDAVVDTIKARLLMMNKTLDV